MKERLYLFLGLFFVTIPVFAVDPFTAASLGVSVISRIFGGIGAGAARRRARRKEKAAAARVMALEANRQDIPDFGQEFENPFANLQVATRAAEMQAEQADISLASTLDTLRSTGASAGGATALARAAAQSKRGVSANIQQQEARNAQLRAQGEVQAAQMRQRAEMASFQAQEKREMQQLNRQSSLQSSASQQAAAYGAQQSQMFGQAVGAIGTFAAAGGFGKDGPFVKSQQDPPPVDNNDGLTLAESQVAAKKDELYKNYISDRAEEYINTAPNFGNLPPGQEQVANVFSNVDTNPYASIGISDEYYNAFMQIPVIK